MNKRSSPIKLLRAEACYFDARNSVTTFVNLEPLLNLFYMVISVT